MVFRAKCAGGLGRRGGTSTASSYDRPPVPRPGSSDLDAIWAEVREALAASLPASTFELWLESLRAANLRDGTLEVNAPGASRAWVERRYGALVETVACERIDAVDRVVFTEPAARRAEDDPAPVSLPLNPLHTFERFVIGPGNRLGHAAALAVAELPGEAYNPLFLHGPPGLGKTHLLGAIAAYIDERRPDLTVHCTTAERFTTEFVTCLQRAGPEAFKRLYRNVDALLIDDVQALEGKPKTEEEFVDTFNALHRAGKQIVLSSDRPPEALEHLAERLRDRFHWGLAVELQSPDIRTRLTLLWRMTTSLPLHLDEPEALTAIASKAPENVRRLEGAMTRVAALASMLSEPLTRGLVTRALGSASDVDRRRPAVAIQLSAIQEAVATASGISHDELVSSSRAPRLAHARQLAMYLSRELTEAPLAAIARAFNRDHTTVLYAIRAVEARLEPGSDSLLTIHRAREILGVAATAPDSPAPAMPTSPPPVNIPTSRSAPEDSQGSPQSSTT
jgi:chromosomal replication initiator protein